MKFVKRMRNRIGFALRLDKDWDRIDDSGSSGLTDTLAGPELADPLKALEARESQSPLDIARKQSYSQATAYAVCLNRWLDTNSLAEYLCICLGTLQSRICRWKAWVGFQPSLFDSIEIIPLDFMPFPGEKTTNDSTTHLEGDQHAWDF